MTVSRDEILGTDTGYAALVTKVNNDMVELFTIAAEVEAARDGESSLLDKVDAIDAEIAALTVGTGCPVSANDTTPGYLNGKLLGDTDILLTEGSDGGNETLTISLKSTGQLATMTAATELLIRNTENIAFFCSMAF
jgi:hypothetical protein